MTQKTKERKNAVTCGTVSGYVTHLNKGEKPCEECNKAHNEYRLALYHKRKPKRLREPEPPLEGFACIKRTAYYPRGRKGKNAGYMAHYLAGEKPCEACAIAHSRWNAKEKKRRQRRYKREGIVIEKPKKEDMRKYNPGRPKQPRVYVDALKWPEDSPYADESYRLELLEKSKRETNAQKIRSVRNA